MENGKRDRRVIGLIAISLAVLAIFAVRLVYLQLVRGSYYLERASGSALYSFAVSAARGEILDHDGEVLAGNTTVYSAVLNQVLMEDASLNAVLHDTLVFLVEGKEAVNDTLPVSNPDATGHFQFTNEGRDASEELARLKNTLHLPQYAEADEVMAGLTARYQLEEFAPQWQRWLGGVRWQMELEDFGRGSVFTLARELQESTVAKLTENSQLLPGIELQEGVVRSYDNGLLAPHLLGTLGKIPAEDWDTGLYREDGYALDALVGAGGLEAAFESRLRGVDGLRTIEQGSDGSVLRRFLARAPQPGQTLRLTLDRELQTAVVDALDYRIMELQGTKAAGAGAETNAGAVVVVDVHDGSVLAAASYPTFDLNLFEEDYDLYTQNTLAPLVNRAFTGLYAPGSAFKPTVALAALLSDAVTPEDTVNCTGTYTYYNDYQPHCQQYGHSGPVNLTQALKYSCNIYFYDVGRRVGLGRIDAMAQALGLGRRTGLEMPEDEGRLTTTEDENYSSGLVLQAAIGQGNSAFTPVQLATYAATLANNGTSYRTHLVYCWQDSETGAVTDYTVPEVESIVVDEDGAFDTVRTGMVEMGSTLSAIRALPFSVACKTGSPQRSELSPSGYYYTNSVLIAYAPAENPQVAVAVVLEYGGGGANGAALLADVLRAAVH